MSRVRPQAYITLEQALIKKLVRAWRLHSRAVYDEIAQRCRAHEWDEARRLVGSLDMTEVGTEHREWIKYVLLTTAVFGAQMVAEGQPSFVGVGSFDDTLNQVASTFLQYLEHTATAQVQDQALQLIAEDEQKATVVLHSGVTQKWDESRHPRGDDGQWVSTYTPDETAPEAGEWQRFPEDPALGPFNQRDPVWRQQHLALVHQALQGWVGDSVTMHLHMRDALAHAPMPSSGGGKQMRAQAEALIWEMDHHGLTNPVPLYRGSRGDRPGSTQSWSENREEAEKWAKISGGTVGVLPAGTAKGLRLRDYAPDSFGEKQWVVRAGNDVVQKQEHSYGTTQVNIAADSSLGQSMNAARAQIAAEDCEGQGLDVEGHHVTIRYGLHSGAVDDLRDYIAQLTPFVITAGKVIAFPPSEHSDGAAPLVVEIESPELHTLNAEFEKLAKFKESSFATYIPHASLAYLKPEAVSKYQDLRVQGSFVVDRITIAHQHGVVEVIPFGIARPLQVVKGEYARVFKENPYRDGKTGEYASGPMSVNVGGRTIEVVKPKRARGDTLLPIKVAAFDANFRQSKDSYIGAGGSGPNVIGDRYARFGAFIATQDSIEAPEVSVRDDGVVIFTNGRHRYAWLRDHGVTTIPMAISPESVTHAKKFGYVVAQKFDESEPRDQTGKWTAKPVAISKEVAAHTGMEMVSVQDLIGLRNEDRRVEPKGSMNITEPTETLLPRLTQELRKGVAIQEPLVVAYDTAEGRALVEDGNTRLAAIEDAGFTHAPVILSRHSLHGFGRPVPKLSLADAGIQPFRNWLLPSEVGLHTLGRSRKFDSLEPRDATGKWTEGGAGEDQITVHTTGRVSLPGRYDTTEIGKGALVIMSKKGYLALSNIPSFPTMKWVSHVWVSEKYRRQGVALSLYEAGLRAVHKMGLEGIVRGDMPRHPGSLGMADTTSHLWQTKFIETGRTKTLRDENGRARVALVKESVKKADPSGRFVTPHVSFAKQGEQQLHLIASLNSSRLATWGFTAEAEARGIVRYKLSATLDGGTSAFCRAINGKVFDVADARKKVLDVLAVQNPDDLRVLQPWPKQTKAAIAAYKAMTPEELTALGLHIPPFHPRCRTMCRKLEAKGTGYEVMTPQPLPSATGPQTVSAETMKELGLLVTPKQLDQWNHQVGMSPVQVLESLTGKAPTEILQGVFGPRAIQFPDTGEILFNLRNIFKSTKYATGLVLDPYSGTLYLSKADLVVGTPGQETAFLKRLFTGMIDVGQTAGLEALAVQVGQDAASYAQLGFVSDQDTWETLRQRSLHLIAQGEMGAAFDALPEETRTLVAQLLTSTDPLTLATVAQVVPQDVLGALLAEIQGQFTLDLTNSLVVQQAQAYLQQIA